MKYGAGVAAGYFSQDAAERIAGNATIIETLEQEAPTHLIPKLYDMLAAFLFRGDDIHKPLSVLSGGEKSRLALLRLLLTPLNVLILDEPTNHLDLHSKDVLLDALQRFEGTVIFVSHDKFFIQGLATRILELTASEESAAGTRIRDFPGTYDYYLYRIAAENSASESDGKRSTAAPPHAKAASRPSSSASHTGSDASGKKTGQSLYEAQKQQRTEKRKREKEEERLMTELTETEDKIKALEALLSEPDVYADGENIRRIRQEIKALTETAQALTDQWDALVSAVFS